ncbi:MAG TPA: methyltransferase domain-containing protein, partial [Acidimicrobiales bacterium]
MTERIRGAAQGFAQNTAAYEAARPSYPAEAVAYIVGHGQVGPGRRVLDLAAGTGKLTRLLVPTGAEVVAVEPVAAMRERLRELLPGVDVRDGTAEAMPLADRSVDVITAAQAFHWFDPTLALAEMHRVLRRHGHLFLTWNIRDRSHDWVRQFGDLLVEDPDAERPYDSYYDVDYPAVIAAAGGFTPVELWTHAWEQPCDPALLVARAESVSVVGSLPPADKQRVLDRVRRLADTHPALAGRDRFPFPY